MYRIALMVVMAAAVAVSQPRWRDREEMPGPRGGHGEIMNQLDLTAEQEQKVEKMRSEMEKGGIASRAKLQTLRVELRDMMKDEKAERTAIESKISEISRAQTEMKLAHLGFWFDVDKILTPDQKKVWNRHRAAAAEMPDDMPMRRMRRGHVGRGMGR